jgi:putative restriction endonuclease
MLKNLWSREELILAFNLYLKLPFGKMHKHNPEIIQLANLLGRSPSSIGMRLGNFASCDPYHQARGVGGLQGGLKQVQPIWDEFFNNREELIYLSELFK